MSTPSTDTLTCKHCGVEIELSYGIYTAKSSHDDCDDNPQDCYECDGEAEIECEDCCGDGCSVCGDYGLLDCAECCLWDEMHWYCSTECFPETKP